MNCSGRLLAALLAASTCLTLDAAIADQEWKFSVHNNSNSAVIEFRTQQDGEWSKNWIAERIEPGDTEELAFFSSEGTCVVRTQIHFTTSGFFDADVDYCKADLIEIYDDKLVWKASE